MPATRSGHFSDVATKMTFATRSPAADVHPQLLQYGSAEGTGSYGGSFQAEEETHSQSRHDSQAEDGKLHQMQHVYGR